jgi:transcriptional regulator with XRE-family HTH domain
MEKQILNIGNRLKDLRLKSNYNQKELSKIIGVSYTQLGRYEKGESIPNANHLDNFANAFGTTIDYIIRGNSDFSTVALKDTLLVTLFKKIEKLPSAKRKIAKELIDAYIFKAEIKLKLEN